MAGNFLRKKAPVVESSRYCIIHHSGLYGGPGRVCGYWINKFIYMEMKQRWHFNRPYNKNVEKHAGYMPVPYERKPERVLSMPTREEFLSKLRKASKFIH